MKKSIFSLLIIMGFVYLGAVPITWAQAPNITVELIFDKPSFDYGEPIGATVVVTNQSGQTVYINRGFSSVEYYLEMRVIDPAGRLVLPARNEEHIEFPDAPPLPFILDSGQNPIRVARCELLPTEWVQTSRVEDLRLYYPMKFPGDYSFQVQLSAMTFEGNEIQDGDCAGNVDDYQSLGVFKSETKYIYAQGSTDVCVIPPFWLADWQKGKYCIDDIAVMIWPEKGKTADDYRIDHIQLNNVTAKRVMRMYSALLKKSYLLALFDKRSAVQSLGQIEVGQWYQVVISGMLESNQFFGGAQKVLIFH